MNKKQIIEGIERHITCGTARCNSPSDFVKAKHADAVAIFNYLEMMGLLSWHIKDEDKI